MGEIVVTEIRTNIMRAELHDDVEVRGSVDGIALEACKETFVWGHGCFLFAF